MQEIVFEAADNSIAFLLRANTLLNPTLKVIDLSDISRMVLKREDGFTIDSVKESTLFDWATLAASGIVTIQLGSLNLKNGIDKWRLKVYDSTNPNGVVWGNNDFTINVKKEYAFSS